MEGKVILMSSDNQTFEVVLTVVMESQTIQDLMRLAGDINTQPRPTIPLANVSGDILTMVIKYCEYHLQAKKADSGISPEDVQKWDKQLVSSVDRDTWLKLLKAADYLKINDLIDLTCQTLADDICSCKDAEEIRQKYHIENDLSDEEES